VMMRASVHRFMRMHRGRGSALAYRISTLFSAIARLLLIVPLMLLGNRVVRHRANSLRKWMAILRWSLGMETAATGTRIRKRSADS
jgi:hypothetical protein